MTHTEFIISQATAVVDILTTELARATEIRERLQAIQALPDSREQQANWNELEKQLNFLRYVLGNKW